MGQELGKACFSSFLGIRGFRVETGKTFTKMLESLWFRLVETGHSVQTADCHPPRPNTRARVPPHTHLADGDTTSVS